MNQLLAQVKIPVLNSSKFPNANPIFTSNTSTLGDVVTLFLPVALAAAGLILAVMLVMGGINLMTAGGDPAKSKQGYGMIMWSVVGFLIIFAAYFVAQIVEVIFGIKFL